MKNLFLIILTILFGLPAVTWGNILDMTSPKLQQFVESNRQALHALTNCFADAFSNRDIQIYYFYTKDNAVPRASHYPDEAGVSIMIRENQEPFDEFICLYFEAVNSKSEKNFLELYAQAESGAISKTNFVREMRRVEFTATKTTRDLIKGIKFNEDLISRSYFYKRFNDCPSEFDKFLEYQIKISPHRSVVKELEEKYDSLRKP